MKINLVGQIFGSSGYSQHTRQLFNALAEDADVKLDVQLHDGWELMVNDKELAAIKQPWYDDGITICIATPPYWSTARNLPCSKFVGCVVWEGDIIPDCWVKPLSEADLIIMPSQHVKDAILKRLSDGKTGLSDIMLKAHIVPHGVDTLAFQPDDHEINPPHVFTFMANKGWSQGLQDRGGIQWVVKAYCEEFKPEEPVQLNIKINMTYASPGWTIQAEKEKLNLPNPHAAMNVSCDDVIPSVMPSLYKGADVFVTAAMAEAFNIPCAEAMASGMPVITTAYGGQTDFVNNENGWLIPGEMFEVKHDLQYEGVQWMLPDMNALKAAMRQAYNDLPLVREKSIKARERTLTLTWRDAAGKMLDILRAEMNK